MFINIRKANESVRKEVLYNIFLEFEIFSKRIWLTKRCFSETYSTLFVGKILTLNFPIRNFMKKNGFITTAF
jgi:hypothetical protein